MEPHGSDSRAGNGVGDSVGPWYGAVKLIEAARLLWTYLLSRSRSLSMVRLSAREPATAGSFPTPQVQLLRRRMLRSVVEVAYRDVGWERSKT